MRLFVTISIACCMFLHAVFGCCWHHAHEAFWSHAAHEEHDARDEHVAYHDHDSGHAHHDSAHDHVAATEAAVEGDDFGHHHGCPHSDGDPCCDGSCKFVPNSDGLGASRIVESGWAPVDVEIASIASLSEVSIATSDRRCSENPALPVRAHLALQILLI